MRPSAVWRCEAKLSGTFAPVAGPTPGALAEFIADVRAGLAKPGQKELPPKYFYDEVGSALFEVITLLPEYGLTRADTRLLRRHADEAAQRLTGPVAVVELGSGSGKKTRWVLEALARRPPAEPVRYFPIDISPAALRQCQRQLGSLPAVEVAPVEKPYLEGLRAVAAQRSPQARLLVLFLGSTIGNFHRREAEEFLAGVRRALAPGDALLLGTDLEKPPRQLLLAYNDPLGVTAAFNLNLLARINRELGGDFLLPRWRHEACWNPAERRIEMRLRSLEEQTVHIRRAGLVVQFERDETLWTESCYKFDPQEVVALGARLGFATEAQWVDAEWPFAETLFVGE